MRKRPVRTPHARWLMLRNAFDQWRMVQRYVPSHMFKGSNASGVRPIFRECRRMP
jgi:hypothetical protein